MLCRLQPAIAPGDALDSATASEDPRQLPTACLRQPSASAELSSALLFSFLLSWGTSSRSPLHQNSMVRNSLCMVFALCFTMASAANVPWTPLKSIICGAYSTVQHKCDPIFKFACSAGQGQKLYDLSMTHASAMVLPRVLTNDYANQHNVAALLQDLVQYASLENCKIYCKGKNNKIGKCSTSTKTINKMAIAYRGKVFKNIYVHGRVAKGQKCKKINYSKDVNYRKVPNRVVAISTIAAYVFGDAGWRIACPHATPQQRDFALLTTLLGPTADFEAKWMKYAHGQLRRTQKGRRKLLQGVGPIGGTNNDLSQQWAPPTSTPSPGPTSTPNSGSTGVYNAGLGGDTINPNSNQNSGLIGPQTQSDLGNFMSGAVAGIAGLGGSFEGAMSSLIQPMAQAVSSFCGQAAPVFEGAGSLAGELGR